MRTYRRMFQVVACVTIVCASVAFFTPVSSAKQTVRMAVTDLEGLEQLQREYGTFRDLLSKLSGMNIEFFAVPNRTAAVEAIRSKKIDVVLTGPAEYVVFRKLAKTIPVVGFSRPDYFADIIVMADSEIQNVKDLKGQKVAFGGVGSTSKHLAPMQVMADYGLKPRRDIKAVHTSVDLGWAGLKRGDVAAFCTTDDKLRSLRNKETEFPPGAFRVIARSRDLPNDLLVAGVHVKKEIVHQLKKVFLKNKQALADSIVADGDDTKKFIGMTFLPNVKDSDYNYVRMMYATIGYPQFSEFVGD